MMLHRLTACFKLFYPAHVGRLGRCRASITTSSCLLQALDAGGEGDGGHSKGLDIASLVHRYGRSFVHSNPDVALEYYMRVGGHKETPCHRGEMKCATTA